jgi:gluconokinase
MRKAERMTARLCTVGLDLGTTTLKAIAFDDTSGQPIARAAAHVALLSGGDASESEAAVSGGDEMLRAEQDPDSVAEAATAILAQVVAAARALNYSVVRVGISAAMHSFLPLGADERPLSPALLWMDGRAMEEAHALWETSAGKALYARTGAPIHAMTPLAKLLWLRARRPEIHAAAARFVSLKEWVWRRWLGGWEVDASIASATGLYNLRENAWDREALRLAGIDATRLSALVPTTIVRAGLGDERLLAAGLSAQTPFVIGASDGALANLGLGVVAGGAGEASDSVALTIGTSLALRVGRAEPLTDLVTRAFCYVLDRGQFVVGGASNSGGGTLEWLGRVLRGGAESDGAVERHLSALLMEAGEVEVGDLLCLPYLTGERAPLWSEQARASFLGLDAQHTPAHLMRAACEGIIFNAWWIASGVFTLVGRPRAILTSGRVLELPWMRQLVADVFDLPVRTGSDADASAKGAAILARIATGATSWDATLRDASQQFDPDGSAVARPIAAHAARYRERAQRFRQVAETLAAGQTAI